MTENNTNEFIPFADRVGNNLNRRKLTIVSQTPNEMIVDVTRADGDVTSEGSKLTASKLNEVFSEIKSELNSQDKGTKVKINGVGQEELNFTSDPQTQITNIVNNTSKISNASGGFSAGNGAECSIDAIQLGAGTNSNPKSLQVYNDNIYNAETHTLTVQNIESDSIPIGLPIGSIITSAVPLTDASVHLLDGSTISQTGIYADFVTYLKSQISAGYDLSCTQTKFDNDVQSTGNCGKFVIDDTAGTIRLPKITRFIQGLSSINDIGKSFSAGLPNIYGEINIPNGRSATGNSYFNVSGAFEYKENASQIGNAGDAGLGGRIIIDANSGSSVSGIYGNSPTVQPQATQYPYYIVLTNSVKTDIVVDIDNVTTELNNISHELTNRVSKTDYNALGDYTVLFSGTNIQGNTTLNLNESVRNFAYLVFRGDDRQNGVAENMIPTRIFRDYLNNDINRLNVSTDSQYFTFVSTNDTQIRIAQVASTNNLIEIYGVGRLINT